MVGFVLDGDVRMDDDGDGDDVFVVWWCELNVSMCLIDYFVCGEWVKMNVWLCVFVEMEVCWKMLCDENYVSWVWCKGCVLWKEIVEVMVMCVFICEELVVMDGSVCGEKFIVVFDLCSGKGLTSSVCAETLGKNCEVIMVDSDCKMKLMYLDSER